MENINEMGHSFTKEEIIRYLSKQPISHYYTLEEITNIIDTLYPDNPFVEHTDENGNVYCWSDECDLKLKFQKEVNPKNPTCNLYGCLLELRHSNELLNSRNGLIPIEEIDEAIQAREMAYNQMKTFVSRLWAECIREPKKKENKAYKRIDDILTINGTEREKQAFQNALNAGYMEWNVKRDGYVWIGAPDGTKASNRDGTIAQFAYFVQMIYDAKGYRDGYRERKVPLKALVWLFEGVTTQKGLYQAKKRLFEQGRQDWQDAIDYLIPQE